MMKVISWNCRGLGQENKKEMTRRLIQKEKPQVLLIQETKMKDTKVLLQSPFIWKNSNGKVVSSREELLEAYVHCGMLNNSILLVGISI
jgi:exonuclease III